MNSKFMFTKTVLVLGLATCGLPSLTLAQHYTQINLVSNTGDAPLNDPNLQNAWGLVASPGSPWWVSNNAGGTSTLYSIDASGAAHLIPINPAPDEFCKKYPTRPASLLRDLQLGLCLMAAQQIFFWRQRHQLFLFSLPRTGRCKVGIRE